MGCFSGYTAKMDRLYKLRWEMSSDWASLPLPLLTMLLF